MSSTAFPPLSPSEPPRVFGAPTLHTDGDLLAVGISSDGTLWAVEEPGELRNWHLGTRRLLASRPLEEGLATLWAFNWACRLIASASEEVNIWEASSASLLTSWSTPSWITALAFQPGHAVLATGHDDAIVRVWDWADQKMLCELEGHDSPISAVSFSWDGNRIATASEDRAIHVWDLRTGKRLGSLLGHKDRIPALAWHPDNRQLYSAAWDTTVRVWDTASFEPIILLNSHATQVLALALSADGTLLASADSDNAVHVWDTCTHEPQTILLEGACEIRCMAFPPDDGRGNLSAPLLAFGGADRVIHLWDSRQGLTAASGVDPLVSRTTVAVSPDGNRLYSLGSGTDLRVWDIASGEPVLTLQGEPLLDACAVSPDARWLAGVHRPNGPDDRSTLAMYDARTGRRVAGCDGQRGPITALAFRGDAAMLATGGVRSSDVWLWEVPSGQAALLIPDLVSECSIETLAFQPGGSLLAAAGIDWLATGGSDGQVVLWHVEQREVIRTLPGGATAIAFHPTGKQLACASLRRIIRIHDTDDGRVLCEMTGHLDTVTCLAFSPDGRWVVSGSDDRTLRVWNALTGELTAAWELDNPLRALAFAPDGKHLYTGNGNTSCYQIDFDQLLASGM